MILSEVQIKGFRNFKDTTINFSEKSLIIGENDIGKSNLIYALRLLLDKGFSENDLIPNDNDFYIHENTQEFQIKLKFENVTDDCIRGKIGTYISNTDLLYLVYRGSKDINENRYEIFASHSGVNTELTSIPRSLYIKVLHLRYIQSSRDLFGYIQKEKKEILQATKNFIEVNHQPKKTDDDTTLTNIETLLNSANDNVKNLHFVKRATDTINVELEKLSIHHTNNKIAFDVFDVDTSKFTENLRLVSEIQESSLSLGGEGRSNQIYFALWASRNDLSIERDFEVCLYCIEEPEAHLHPHQQRKLANYLYEHARNQIIISSHSPQIACEFPPNSIIRLYNNVPDTKAANNGCGQPISDAILNFGFRLNILPAEAFFSSVVFLVEGVSEELLYKALAKANNIDLDKLNISILQVDGVGFEYHIELLNSLKVDWVIRTDNDIFKVPYSNPDRFRAAGLQRVINIYNTYVQNNTTLDTLIFIHEPEFRSIVSNTLTADLEAKLLSIKIQLETHNIYLANNDLENDLLNSALSAEIQNHYSSFIENSKIKMTKGKGTFMFSFLQNNSDKLNLLINSDLLNPLQKCKEIAEAKWL
ncbi:MAG: AAA family ATPase [Limnohabitans sp.]|nr:AAA family ATPase [Limnohabitans sp.]